MESVLPDIKTPWGEIGYPVYKRTYSRRMNENNVNSPTEEFKDTIERVIKACRTQLKCGFTPDEEKQLAKDLLELKGSVAGRFLWQLGTKTVTKLGLPSLQNCSFVVCDSPIRPFTWAIDLLMLGCGVGVNIQKENVNKIPKVTKKRLKITRYDDSGADFIVPDSREGWVKLLGKVLKSYFYSGEGFTYSTQLIRGYGSPIKGFGGTASGSEILVEGIEHICAILDKRRGDKLQPIDCLDIIDIIGMIVVAGNVRRSAIIAIGDSDDIDYLNSKRWDLGSIPNWRVNSNNSVVCNDINQLTDNFWDLYNGNGEPFGLINLGLARKCGRLGETQYPDSQVQGFNPCAEQSLENFETCCLAEVFLPNITSEEELHRVVKSLYRINKHSLSLPCHIKETEEVVHRNMRMGIGMTGICQATQEQLSWLSDCYKMIREFDEEYSREHGFNTSIKLTTVKPSGSLSLLAGVTSGGHPAYSQYYIRRMRIASNSPLIEIAKTHGYHVEYAQMLDGSNDHTTMIISFPCKFPEHSRFAKDMSAIDQMELVKWLQSNWSDNAVSVTIYYKKEELPAIREWLKLNYNNSVKTMSFLLHSDHGFKQAPLEEITEEEYNLLVKNTIPITSLEVNENDIDASQIGCETGVCPIK